MGAKIYQNKKYIAFFLNTGICFYVDISLLPIHTKHN